MQLTKMRKGKNGGKDCLRLNDELSCVAVRQPPDTTWCGADQRRSSTDTREQEEDSWKLREDQQDVFLSVPLEH